MNEFFAAAAKQMRLRAQLDLGNTATDLGVPIAVVIGIESGKVRPSLDTSNAYNKRFGVDLILYAHLLRLKHRQRSGDVSARAVDLLRELRRHMREFNRVRRRREGAADA